MILGESKLSDNGNSNDKKKITFLWVSDDPWQKTGYGMVGRNVLKRLAKEKDIEVIALGTQFRGGEIEYEGYKVVSGFKHPDGFDALGFYIKKYNPDVVVTLRDIGLQAGYVPAIEEARKNGWTGRWYGYCPLDTKVVVREWIPIWDRMDGIIAMSEWGKLTISHHTKDRYKIVTIPHGVDTKVFKPIKEEIRNRLRDAGAPFSEMFIVGAVGRNQYRKMWYKLFEGFSKFAKDKSDVMLLIHSDSDPVVVSDGWSYNHIAEKYGMRGKWQLTYPKLDIQTRFNIDDEKMNEIYNSFDVFCLPTGGEGFGVPLIEAQAAGVPVVTTAYTTGFELVKGHGELIPPLKDTYGRDVTWVGQNGVEFVIPDDNKIAEALQKLYDDKKLREKYSKESREFSLKYDWDKINELWVKLIKERPTQLKNED
ncbi:MAG: glycosyltransferase, partial [Candidatus Schekmanbacteria bacterium]